MVNQIQVKLRNTKKYDSIDFAQDTLPVSVLKELISEMTKIVGSENTINVFVEGSKHQLHDYESVEPNMQIVYQRVPIPMKERRRLRNAPPPGPSDREVKGQRMLFPSQHDDGDFSATVKVNKDITEEERMNAITSKADAEWEVGSTQRYQYAIKHSNFNRDNQMPAIKNKCLNCGHIGHFASSCPQKPLELENSRGRKNVVVNSAGVPKSFMRAVESREEQERLLKEGKSLTASGSGLAVAEAQTDRFTEMMSAMGMIASDAPAKSEEPKGDNRQNRQNRKDNGPRRHEGKGDASEQRQNKKWKERPRKPVQPHSGARGSAHGRFPPPEGQRLPVPPGKGPSEMYRDGPYQNEYAAGPRSDYGRNADSERRDHRREYPHDERYRGPQPTGDGWGREIRHEAPLPPGPASRPPYDHRYPSPGGARGGAWERGSDDRPRGGELERDYGYAGGVARERGADPHPNGRERYYGGDRPRTSDLEYGGARSSHRSGDAPRERRDAPVVTNSRDGRSGYGSGGDPLYRDSRYPPRDDRAGDGDDRDTFVRQRERMPPGPAHRDHDEYARRDDRTHDAPVRPRHQEERDTGAGRRDVHSEQDRLTRGSRTPPVGRAGRNENGRYRDKPPRPSTSDVRSDREPAEPNKRRRDDHREERGIDDPEHKSRHPRGSERHSEDRIAEDSRDRDRDRGDERSRSSGHDKRKSEQGGSVRSSYRRASGVKEDAGNGHRSRGAEEPLTEEQFKEMQRHLRTQRTSSTRAHR